MRVKKEGLKDKYFKGLGQKYLIEAIKLDTKQSNKTISKVLGISEPTLKKILKQNTRNLGNFRKSTFKKISGNISKISDKQQLRLALIAKELKKVNNRISKKNAEKLLLDASKTEKRLSDKTGGQIKNLFKEENNNLVFYRLLYEGLS